MPQDGKDADPEAVAGDRLARIPTPRMATPGKDAEVDYQRLQDAIEATAAREVEKQLVEHIATLPQPEPGLPGGRSRSSWSSTSRRCLNRIPGAKDGEDGKSVTIEDVMPLVEEIVQKTISESAAAERR